MKDMRLAGLVRKHVNLPDGTKAHYAERSPAAGVPAEARRDLLVFSGFTMHIEMTAPTVARFLAALPAQQRDCWRVVVMETPMHGLAAEPGAPVEAFPGPDYAVPYVSSLCDALQLGTGEAGAPPLSVLGYSLGGRLACCVAVELRHRVAATVAVAPGFHETLDDGFLQLIEEAPESVHGWQTAAGLRSMMVECCGVDGDQIDAIPGFIRAGLVRERLLHGDGYFARFAQKMTGAESAKTELSDMAADMAAVEAPVLLVLGGRDACVSAAKSVQVQRQFGDNCRTVVLNDYGHVGGPKKYQFPLRTLMTEAGKLAAHFLAEHGGGGSARARL
eukprot:g3213.t1